jgi:hypothetical protein
VLTLLLLAVAAQDPGVDITSGAAAERAQEPAVVDEGAGADLRLVVTGGLGGLHDGNDAFYGAGPFRGGEGGLGHIRDAVAPGLRSDEATFFARAGGLTREALLAAAGQPARRERRSVLLGPSVIALFVGDSEGRARDTRVLRRLSAIDRELIIEERGDVLALDPTPDTPLRWPTAETALRHVPGARGVTDAGDELVLLSRAKGATPRALGIVDELLARRDAPPTAYLDVGGALGDERNTSPEVARAMRRLLLARSPAALAVGRSELAAHQVAPGVLSGAPYVVGAAWGDVDSHRVVRVGERRVALTAIGALGERTVALLPAGVAPHDAGASVLAASQLQADVSVGVALSSEGGSAALGSTAFDTVFHLQSSRLGALPAIDDIDYRPSHAAGLHAGAGLVRVSSGDVTEVYLWLVEGRVARQRVVRHAIVDDGVEAADAVAALAELRRPPPSGAGGLPERPTPWRGGELDDLLGGLVRVDTRAHLSVLPRLPEPASVASAVPPALARVWLSTSEPIHEVEVEGAALAQVLAAARRLPGLHVTGGDLGQGTVAQRALHPLETYRVAIGASARAALADAGAPLPAPTRASSLRVSDVVDAHVAGGLDAGLADRAMRSARGEAAHTVLVDVEDIALNVSLHTLSGADGYGAVRESRLQTPDSLSLGASGRLALRYEGPWLGAAVIGTNQFARTTLRAPDGGETVQEPRDLVLAEADARVPLPRMLGLDPILVPQPGVRVAYQTEWTPNESVVDGRLSELPRKSELRGFAGVTWHGAPFLDELRLGGVIENDFAAAQVGSLEWGAEAAARGSWRLASLRLSLTSSARYFVPDPDVDSADDLGLVLQAIARAEMPAVFGLNVGLFADLLVAQGKVPQTSGVASSVLFGAALSYGDRFKWLP